MSATIDHLIVGADTLEQGAAYIEEHLGVAMQTGGRHVAMGTHNRVLKLGPRVYLEVIAIDPAGNAPSRPRWFGLDDAATRQSLKVRPRLLTWAARTLDIDAAAKDCPMAAGTIHPMARGDYTWKITIPDDGRLVCDGLMPTLIQWIGDMHPADKLEERGAALVKLAGAHPQADALRTAMHGLGLESAIEIVNAQRAELSATLRGSRGSWTISS